MSMKTARTAGTNVEACKPSTKASNLPIGSSRPWVNRNKKMSGGRRHILDFYLPGDFHDVFRSEVEPVDDFHRVPVKEGEKCHAPTLERGPHRLGYDQITSADEHRLVQINGLIESLRVIQRDSQIGNFDKSESCNHVPQTFADVLHQRALWPVYTRRVFKNNAERDGVPR